MVKRIILMTSLFFVICLNIFSSCSTNDGSSDTSTTTTTSTGPWIFIASGSKYAGNTITTSTPANVIVRYSTAGVFEEIIRDYTSNPGDSPVAIANWDTDNLLVVVENTGGRKIEFVRKDGTGVSNSFNNATALSAVLRDVAIMPDGGFLVSKSSALEKFSSTFTRITSGANPYVSAPAAPCATVATLLTGVTVGPSGNIFTTHAAASPNNKAVIINTTGYSVAGDCIASIASPGVNHFPTAILYHSTGNMLISYGNATGPVHQIYAYDAAANNLTGATQAYNNTSVLQGISAMAEMTDTSVLVAASISSFNTIEKFTYDSGTKLLTRVGTTPFIQPSVFVRSVSGIVVTD